MITVALVIRTPIPANTDIVAGNATPLADGHAFSIEPGVYLPGRFGLRLEDIVVARADGPERLNLAARDLAVVA